MGITVNSTIEELEEYVGSEQMENTPYNTDEIIMVALAKNDYRFDISYGRSDLGDIAFDYAHEGITQEFEEGGRWSNFVRDIFKFDIDGETYYVAMSWEQGATESQEHGEAELSIVQPVEKTVITYV